MANPMYGQNKFDNDAAVYAVGKVEVETVSPSADGTAIAGAETKVINANESGKHFFVNIASNTATFRLPAVANNAGVNFHFQLNITADAEATKDMLIFTDATDEYIIGPLLDGGTVHDSGVSSDGLRLDTSDGAAGAGDHVSLLCDGAHWYVPGSDTLTAGAWNVETATRS